MAAGKKPLSKKRQAWYESEEFERVQRRATDRAREAFRAAPKCSAKAKSTGGPCGNLALENGKCRYHGGRTPKGAKWHRATLDNPGKSVEVMSRKAKDLERRKAEQEARRAGMTPEERARHYEWHRTHKPGSATVRDRTRRDREAAALVRSLGVTAEGAPDATRGPRTSVDSHTVPRARSGPPAASGGPESEAERIARLIRQLEAHEAALKQPGNPGPTGDVFD